MRAALALPPARPLGAPTPCPPTCRAARSPPLPLPSLLYPSGARGSSTRIPSARRVLCTDGAGSPTPCGAQLCFLTLGMPPPSPDSSPQREARAGGGGAARGSDAGTRNRSRGAAAPGQRQTWQQRGTSMRTGEQGSSRRRHVREAQDAGSRVPGVEQRDKKGVGEGRMVVGPT